MEIKCSPILANYVTNDLFDRIISVLTVYLIFIEKYFDDIMLAFPSNRTGCILGIFNSVQDHITFTMELKDINHSTPFPVTRIIGTESNMLLTEWYRKHINFSRFLNY